ncbi:MAG: CBS domain-containing protein [Desulfosarcinaceae bacterium]|nr:CBS domain-containing protein [Desulfosarcinaceae bacterium]
MTTAFHTLTPQMTAAAAVERLVHATRVEGRRIFGLMVVDADDQLVGMLSMYDILLFMRPKHTHIWGMMEDIDLVGIVNRACDKTRGVLVGDIMSTDVVTIGPQTHLMMILDVMIKKHIRRLPVVEAGRILGIVYISDLFYNILDRFTAEEARDG